MIHGVLPSFSGEVLIEDPGISRLSTAMRLRKIGERGILVIKDFTSILSTDRHVRAAMPPRCARERSRNSRSKACRRGFFAGRLQGFA